MLFGGISLLKGDFLIAKHEGDTLHLLQIVFRIADGEWPHLDFMTPIGFLAFWPIAIFVKAGFGIGTAIFAGQFLFALALSGPVLWASYSRFPNALAFVFSFSFLSPSPFSSVTGTAFADSITDPLVSDQSFSLVLK